ARGRVRVKPFPTRRCLDSEVVRLPRGAERCPRIGDRQTAGVSENGLVAAPSCPSEPPLYCQSRERVAGDGVGPTEGLLDLGEADARTAFCFEPADELRFTTRQRSGSHFHVLYFRRLSQFVRLSSLIWQCLTTEDNLNICDWALQLGARLKSFASRRLTLSGARFGPLRGGALYPVVAGCQNGTATPSSAWTKYTSTGVPICMSSGSIPVTLPIIRGPSSSSTIATTYGSSSLKGLAWFWR